MDLEREDGIIIKLNAVALNSIANAIVPAFSKLAIKGASIGIAGNVTSTILLGL